MGGSSRHAFKRIAFHTSRSGVRVEEMGIRPTSVGSPGVAYSVTQDTTASQTEIVDTRMSRKKQGRLFADILTFWQLQLKKWHGNFRTK